ncbi:hypothetical protein [Actinoplanes regularis]|uniref:BNR repeat-like domain-containing protein n=1 Tax=Actinoplanes regularis TaxID=52697 RepID=A0A239JNJ6_9ACTN|nr:hypothetical protein [Actinoplanes regularis]GIE92089.1 hypothetical protein Are01nite_85690 [Actinoplanes regularis]SNT07112.1 hypothetical protein SAMN06264365_13652 [Actinoplanes regularis]
MLESQFDRLRSEVGDAVRQPDFSTVRSRAGRVRRRRAITSAAFLATVLCVTGLGYVVQTAPGDGVLADSVPAPTESPGSVWFPSTLVTNAGANLYRVFQRCRECDAELDVSSNGGESWQHRPTPPAPSDATGPRTANLLALAPELVVWRDERTLTVAEVQALVSGDPSADEITAHQPWITRDGGETWQQIAIDTQPVAAVPEGVRPVDCAMLDVSTCDIGVIDPVTGRFAPLAAQPTGITVQEGWTDVVNVPLDGHLWVPGLDPATNKPAVATSSDAGRTWHTHVFTGAVAAVLGHGGPVGLYNLPKVAAGSGKAAYVLTYRADGVLDAHYTPDGGSTWRDGDTIRNLELSAGFVTADGAHIVTTDTGLAAGRGTGRYTPITLPGYPVDTAGLPVDPARIQVASGQTTVPYLVNSDNGPYLSEDGRTWRRVRLP